jgi:hypothetical protein
MNRESMGPSTIDLDAECDGLPAVAASYFRRVLGSALRPVLHLRMDQCGTLRSGTESGRWMRFRAVHAALHRYLAEAVWYPSALLPSSGVQWSAIDERRAMASLSNAGMRAVLEFRFNDAGEVESVFTPGRWQQVGKSYRMTPWEGRFSDYRQHQGLRVPFKGEVGWHTDDRLDIVWRGEVTQLDYVFAEPAP